MPIGSIAICSRALLKLGATSISSFDEGTAEAEVAANLYPSTRDAMLAVYPWSFAVAQTTLPKLAASPVADFKNAFKLPSDFLRIISAGIGNRGRGINYRIVENRLHTDSDSVNLTYIFRPDEKSFPPYFTQVLIARLAAEFCIPLTESTTRSDVLTKMAEEEFKRARLIDAQQESPKCFEDYSLVEVRK
ncbi:MAG: hypothetical protein AB7U85_02105 [Alphaproteobacteria bacterium]